MSAYNLLPANDKKPHEFEETRTLFIISNVIPFSPVPRLSNPYSSVESDNSEDMDKLLKGLVHKQQMEENKFFDVTPDEDYESLGNLRIKRMRESLESPVFGSKVESYASQRNLVRGLTLTSKDELDRAVPKKSPTHIFQKQLRHFSFNESENSSFPSSYKSTIQKQDTLTSKNTNKSSKTPNFTALKSNRQSSSSKKSSKIYQNPSHFKNHLKSIAQLVGADKNMLNLPEENSPEKNRKKQNPSKFRNFGQKRHTFTAEHLPNVIQIESLKDSESSQTSSQTSEHEPPSMKMIGVQGRVTTKSSGSNKETKFKIKITSEERKQSVGVKRSKDTQGLVPPARKEVRRLSENPRNINLLHDVPRENKRVYKKRKSTRSSRSAGKQLLAKLSSLK